MEMQIFPPTVSERAHDGPCATGGVVTMGFFRREVEVTLKMLGVATLIGLIMLPVAWGYEQRRQARTWQNVACAYRIKEVSRSIPSLTTIERTADACAMLEKLGLTVSPDNDFQILPTTTVSLPVRSR
jgi:hypothetical protein